MGLRSCNRAVVTAVVLAAFSGVLQAQAVNLCPTNVPTTSGFLTGTVLNFFAEFGTRSEKTLRRLYVGKKTGRRLIIYTRVDTGEVSTCSYVPGHAPVIGPQITPRDAGPKALATPALSPSPTSGTAATLLAYADVNGDGIPDIVMTAQDLGQVMVYLANADDSTQPGVAYSVGATPTSIAAADVNGDGFVDLVVTNSDSNNLSVLLGKGDGTFRPAQNFNAGTAPSSVVVGDFNGDGKPDLAVASEGSSGVSGALSLLLGNGDGTFQAAAALVSPGGLSVVAADFNGDGKLDLGLGQYNPTTGAAAVQVLLGNGNGTFQKPVATGYGPGNPDFLGFGDFNGDGKLDLAISHANTDSVTILQGNGDGTFRNVASYIAGELPYDFSLLDFYGDGHLDIVAGDLNSQPLLQVLYGIGDGSFHAPTYSAIPSQTPTNVPVTNSIAVADFNGDGKLDVAATSLPENYVSVFLGQGGSKLAAGTNIAIPQSSSGPAGPAFVVARDFNGDGKPDLALADQQSNSVSILLGNGDGTFQTPLTYAAGANPQYLAIGDFNGDGKPDLAVANSASLTPTASGNISILLNNGNGTFQSAANYTAGTHPYAIVIGDFNGDGKLDLAVVNDGAIGGTDKGGLWILLGNGDGTFRAATNIGVGQNPVHLAAADINGDGKLDLIIATTSRPGAGSLAILLGKGDGTFQTPVLATTFNLPQWISILDINGDGIPDIVDAEQGDLGYFQGNGDGTFQSEVPFPGGENPSALAVADFNGDKLPDLAVADGAGGISILLNQPPSAATLQVSSSAPAPSGSGVAAESIASAYGSDLATTTLSATGTSSTNLGGTTIQVMDSAGASRAGILFYVSPSQVNFQIPPGTANGTATVTVQSADGTQSSGTVQVNAIAPGIYTSNAAGVAAALAFSYQPNGSYTYQNTAQANSANQIVANPISLDPQSNQIYLELYGTGLRHAAAGSVTVKVGSMTIDAIVCRIAKPVPGPRSDRRPASVQPQGQRRHGRHGQCRFGVGESGARHDSVARPTAGEARQSVWPASRLRRNAHRAQRSGSCERHPGWGAQTKAQPRRAEWLRDWLW